MHLLLRPRNSCAPPTDAREPRCISRVARALHERRTMAAPSLHVRAATPRAHESWSELWARTALTGALLVLVYFAAWELAERTFFSGVDVHALHLFRGVAGALLLATWSFLHIRRSRLACDAEMQELVAHLDGLVVRQEKMARLGTLAAGFAHDIGNPLASISAELEMLEGERDVARFDESLGVLRRHVGRMSRTLREMVDFARRRRDAVSDVSIALAVEDAARLVRHDPRWKKVRLEVDVSPALPSVHMVEDHLVLVLVNLMLNAADAMPDGGTLSVRGARRPGGVELRLRDTGIGMTPDVLDRATTPLFTTKPRGTGLGLAVSSSILRAIGGSLRIESTPGEGTEVVIALPGGDGHG